MAAELNHDHPAAWSTDDMTAILSRLFLQERTGLLEQKMIPQPVFLPDEISQLVPKIQAAFRMAKPSEWVVFYSERSTGVAAEITSGGLFLKERQLHIVIANHGSWMYSVKDTGEEVRANPMRSEGGKGIALSFDPPRFILRTQANWMGGASGAPAGEIILDYQAFLGEAKPPAPAAVASSPPRTEVKPGQAGDTSLKDQAARPSPEVERLRQRLEEQDGEIAQLKARLKELDIQKKEMERLRQQSDEQNTEIERLKARLTELDMPKRKPPTKKPVR